MFLRFLAVPTAILGALFAAPVVAEVDLSQVQTCVAERIEAGDQPLSCIDEAQLDCTAINPETPLVAVVCFHDASDAWNAGIRDTMMRVQSTGPEDLAVVAGIETKYDILSGLMQCDRMKELAQAMSKDTPEAVQRQYAQCSATAAGLAYARLHWRTREGQ